MPSNIPVGYGQATYSFTHENLGRPLAITLGVSLPSGPVNPQAVANELMQRFSETIMTDIDNSVTLTHVDLFIGNGPDPSGSVRSSIPPKVGERSMVSVPLNSAVLVTKQSGRLGRLGRGRFFVPSSVAATEVSENGNLTGSIVTSLQSRWFAFHAALTDPEEGTFYSGTLNPVIIHQPPHQDQAPALITSFLVGSKIGTRGSRLR